MPSLSPTMTEGNLTKWLVKKGDHIKAGDLIAEIETDKATMELEAVDEGVIKELLFKFVTRYGNKIIHNISGDGQGVIEVNSVTSSNSSNNSGQYFRIQFRNVTPKECIDLSKQSAQYFDIIYIGGGSNGGDEVKEQGEELDVGSLVEECNSRNDNVVSLIKA